MNNGENAMCDVITIGSATMDVFVESDDANIVSVYTKNKKSEFMSYPYGAKVEMTDFASNVGGGGVNTAMNFANLGFKTSAIFKIGDDIYSDGVLEAFKNKDIDLSNIIQDPKISTGFSIILVSFQGDRTSEQPPFHRITDHEHSQNKQEADQCPEINRPGSKCLLSPIGRSLYLFSDLSAFRP